MARARSAACTDLPHNAGGPCFLAFSNSSCRLPETGSRMSGGLTQPYCRVSCWRTCIATRNSSRPSSPGRPTVCNASGRARQARS
eukprot:9487749-Alexandrium_andersonii.AAC.1